MIKSLLLFLVATILCCFSPLGAKTYSIPPTVRFTIEREEESSPIVYYFTPPESSTDHYPILIFCDARPDVGPGQDGIFFNEIRSAFFYHELPENLDVAILTVECRGVDGNLVNRKEFWNHFAPSERLNDHLKVIQHFVETPPANWSGEFIFFGVDEGSRLATDLTCAYPHTLATINFYGASGKSYAEDLYARCLYFNRYYGPSPLSPFYYTDWLTGVLIPSDIDNFKVKMNEIIKNPTPKKKFMGYPYLYIADALKQPPIDFTKIHSPFLVVMQDWDPLYDHSLSFCNQALNAEVPLNIIIEKNDTRYLMGKSSPDTIPKIFKWLKKTLKLDQ